MNADTKGNLLIVDDEEMIVTKMEMLLDGIADKIFTAFDGEQALKVLAQENVDCVICDINMPKMKGMEVLKRVRQDSKNAKIPFIFYTGHGDEALMIEALKYGAFDFLDKPSLDNLEIVVGKGLKTGVLIRYPEMRKQETAKAPEDDAKLMSEYRKMMAKQ